MANRKSVICAKAFSVILLTIILPLISSCKKSPAPSANSQQPAVTSDKPVEMVPLDNNLPKPVYRGTKQDIRVPNLEPFGIPRPKFYVPKGTTNVALGKPVTASDLIPIIGELKMVTDGDKEAVDGSYVQLGPLLQYITVDLQSEFNIYAIWVWHYHLEARVYFDVIVQVADDPDFTKNVITLFNNDIDNSAGLGVGKDMHYIETNQGKLIDAKGVKARYVRLYSRGNSSDDLNNYTEVEVYAKSAN